MHTKKFDPFDFKKKIINGVPVYYKNIPWAPCIHVNVVFNGGATADPKGKEGLAHFMEHITVKGSPKLPDYRSWIEWRKKYTFMTANAATNFYGVFYPLKCLPKDFEKVMFDLKDTIFNCFLKTEDIESERNVILQESWGRYKNEKYLKYIKETRKNLYKNHIFENLYSPLGWPETIKKITPEDVRNFYKDNYGVGNFSIILVGNIENKNITSLKYFIESLPKVKNKFKNTKKQRIIKPVNNLLKVKADEIGLVKEQVEISVIRVAEKIDESKLWSGILSHALLQEILNDKFRVEHKICYSVSVNSSFSRYDSLISMNINTDEKNIKMVLEGFKEVVKEFGTDFYKQKFEDTKLLFKNNSKVKEYLSEDIIDYARNNLAVSEKIPTLKDNLKLIQKTQFKDVQKFIKEMFGDEKKVYTEIIFPSKKVKTENDKK
ncbi:hypothetical protein SDC9_07809 [bioreactor metagenome]|uniref:Zinc protease n=1 Tax=bioreactor metagenome TaxID=1076179 RepID=A0A644T5W6_9ZZZZ|nr:pitrilysin family protein [Candidatus Elulimicrobiales bacterium]